MDTVQIWILAIGAISLTGAPVILRRVKSEYERDGTLSESTVWAVWFFYGLLLAIVVGAALTGAWGLGLSRTLSIALGAPLLLLGVALEVAGVVSMGSMARMNGRQPDRLITEGAFRYSRNPQNFGIGVAGVGVALLGDAAMALLFVLAGIAVFRVYLAFEEAHLERAFGDEFRAYCRRTPRFLGLPALR